MLNFIFHFSLGASFGFVIGVLFWMYGTDDGPGHSHEEDCGFVQDCPACQHEFMEENNGNR